MNVEAAHIHASGSNTFAAFEIELHFSRNSNLTKIADLVNVARVRAHILRQDNRRAWHSQMQAG